MSNKSSHNPVQANEPNFCANCGKCLPQLTSQQRATHRFCSGCGAPIHRGDHDWLPITIDEATGTVVPAEEAPPIDFGRLTIRERLQRLRQNPGAIFALGAGAVAAGGGLLFAVAPLASLGAVIAATGVGIVKTAVIGGVATAIIATKIDDDEAVGSIFKLLGVAALAGLATIAAGGLLGFLATLLPLLGGILLTGGGLAAAGVVAHQVHLHQKRKKHERAALVGERETASAGNISHDTAGISQLLSEFLKQSSPELQILPKPNSDPGLN